MPDSPVIKGLKPFFEPSSLAVIGASRTPGKGGYNIIENLLGLGYTGKIYPVNPQAKEILGVPVYPDIKDTPAPPELALIVLPPALVLPAIGGCIARGVKAIIVESAGFGELDSAGAEVQKEIARVARQAGIRIMGPNSVGTINPYTNFDTSLGRLREFFLPDAGIRQGPVGFAGQTGLFTGVYLPLLNSELGISRIACLGNKCDVDESDMLEYLGADPQTKVIAMYLESIKDGRRFMQLSRRIVREKPVIVLKSAVTQGGAKMSVSHTGSIAGEDRVYDAAFRQSGVIRVEDFEQLFDVAKAFVHSPLPRGNRVAIINLAGSGCVTAVDACVKAGLRIADLSPSAAAKIQTVYPAWWQVRSPIDVWTAIEASGFEAAYTTITRAAMEDENSDAVMVVAGAIDWLPGKDIPGLFKDIKQAFPNKTLFAVNPLGDRRVYLRMNEGFLKIGIPHFSSVEVAVKVLAAMCRYRQYRTQLS
jgi:acetate---CoA ligase (ADP-forming)